MGVVYNQRELNFETYGFPTLVYDFARAGTLRDGVSKRDNYISITRNTTGTYFGSNGLIKTAAAFEPRFEYSIGGSCLGLLIEERRENLATYSEQFNDGSWVKLNSVGISANVTTSPDGTTSADKFVENTNTSHKVLAKSFTLTASTTYTFSLFVKSAERSNIMIHLRKSDYSTRFGGFFNLATKTFTGETSGGGVLASSSIIEYPNNWFRLTITGDIGANTAAVTTLYLCDTNNNIGYAADGTSGLFVWGAQLEEGPFPTSYIPTVASPVTRSADNHTIVSPNFYNPPISSIVLHYTPKVGVATATQTLLAFDNDTVSSEIKMSIVGITPTLNVVDATRATVSIATSPNISTTDIEYRVAFTIKQDKHTLTNNGVGIVTANSGSLPTNVNVMRIGHDKRGNSFNGYIKKLIYYPRELPTSTLAVFSTI